MQERIQKILSARGICSRRKAEEYIAKGMVTVNGKAASIGDKADPDEDRIEVDGSVIEDRKELLYYLLNKPVGIVTTNANMDDQTVVKDLIPPELQGVIHPVGRLDKDSSGLLLLTNDGVVSYRLTHPSFEHEKEYEVETFEPIPDGSLNKLREGVKVLGSKTKPATVRRISDAKYSIILTEGRNRQIRRMSQKVGYPVKNLRRIRILNVTDSSLKPGALRKLHESEVRQLHSMLKIDQ